MEKKQIELLFDSIMRGYPIGTFLFWKLSTDHAGDYVFYEFLKDFNERNPFNRKKEGAFLSEPIIGVLDGQQRLTSIYIGLQGTHAERIKNGRMNNDDAYPETRLYLVVPEKPRRSPY